MDRDELADFAARSSEAGNLSWEYNLASYNAFLSVSISNFAALFLH
jgi:hypothetical protein